jgi:NSS family neurotransmitter:Na+ symporter
MGVPVAVISVVGFGTERGMENLDIVDNWSNNLGIVLSAVAMMAVTMWFKNKGGELSFHLTQLSTFKVGRLWRILVTVVDPVVLGYMLVATAIGLIKTPYGGYDTTYLLQAGWGVLVLGALVSFVMVLVPWRQDPTAFEPYPAYGARPANPDGPDGQPAHPVQGGAA